MQKNSGRADARTHARTDRRTHGRTALLTLSLLELLIAAKNPRKFDYETPSNAGILLYARL